MAKKCSMYQTGTINSLLQAVYLGDTSVADLKEYGDFGLGALDYIDGELIICDGECYRANAKGELNVLPNHHKTPFAVVNKFMPEISFKLSNLNYLDLEQKILPYLPSNNLIYAIRIKGHFQHISLRSEECTTRPFRKLVEILPALQRTFEYSNISGQLVGVWFPAYLSQVNVPGFHFHFADNNKSVGGHVFGLFITEGEVEIQVLHRLELDMIASQEFYDANLDTENKEAVAQVEQVRS